MSSSSGYEQTGVANVSRFTIEGDPRRMFVIPFTGGMVDWGGAPNRELSPYTYNGSLRVTGSTAITVGGVKNLYSTGQAAYSIGAYNVADGADRALSINLGEGSTSYDDIVSGASVIKFSHIAVHQAVDPALSGAVTALPWLDANGEMVIRVCNSATGAFGACNEQFTVAGTVTVVNGSNVVTGAGTAFTTAVLPGYAYVPSGNLIRPGDILSINNAGVWSFHRIVTITDATHLVVSPAWGSANAGGLTYQIGRTGYGSHSNVIQIKNRGSSPLVYAYYAGNNMLANGGTVATYGTIQCALPETGTHFMAPQTSAASDVKAIDVAYYKSFLLYGVDGSIGWSVAGFPTSFATGFGATDFPAGNITVVDTDDDFISFEYLGDQLVALFRHSAWLIQPTGAIPEFSFYRLPNTGGAMMERNSQAVGQTYRRPSCSAPNSVFYTSDFGLTVLTGSGSKVVSGPVNRLAAYFEDTSGAVACTYEPMTNSVYWHGYTRNALAFSLDDQSWRYASVNNIDPNARGISAIPITNYGRRRMSLAFYRTVSANNGRLYMQDGSLGGPAGYEYQDAAVYDWSWNSPIISLGDDPAGFTFGGFQLEGDNITSTPTVHASVQVYAGRTPYKMEAWGGVVTVDSTNNRQILGKKTDAPFIAFRVYGVNWVGLVGLNVYDGRVAKGR